MVTLKFIRLPRKSVKKIKKNLTEIYNDSDINLCTHPHVIVESHGTGLSRENQLYNELVLWLLYCDGLITRRTVYLDLLSKLREDYDKLFGFVKNDPDLLQYAELSEIDVITDAVYGDDYIPRVEIFLKGLEDIAQCLCVKRGIDRIHTLGFINLRRSEVDRLMNSVQKSAARVLSYELLDVRDADNTDSAMLAFNRLVYFCRMTYAMSIAWKQLMEMCVDRINLLRRRLISAFHEIPTFSRVYARNVLDRTVEQHTVSELMRRIGDDFLLVKNAIRWGDPNWGVESDSDDADESNGNDGQTGGTSGDNPRAGYDCSDDECERRDRDFEKNLRIEMVDERPLRWWSPTGYLGPNNEAALWVDEYGDIIKDFNGSPASRPKQTTEKKRGERDKSKNGQTTKKRMDSEIERKLMRLKELELEAAEEKRLLEEEERLMRIEKDRSHKDRMRELEKQAEEEARLRREARRHKGVSSGDSLFTPVDDDQPFVTSGGYVSLPASLLPNESSTLQFDDVQRGAVEVGGLGGPIMSQPTWVTVDRKKSGKFMKKKVKKVDDRGNVIGSEEEYFWDDEGGIENMSEGLRDLNISHEKPDDVRFKPVAPRQFSNSPFGGNEEQQTSGGSDFTVITHDSNV
nr:tegument protein pp150 [Mastomys natalensis cytomegalovirus 3]WEG70284.1 tegument protein pp150 [Mastomys natalensis cytomegalovirus 3]WEG70424.1 tegument protein pp150 [Mastomys natalensis cytomegalovirus 3]WEG70564.1 tegument protein pp150 [Mastomys natalensis cytomegalovirus 3]WEG70844.1 tegument protein pp150 [Mastomys natalensis cytomegalovirus 3]